MIDKAMCLCVDKRIHFREFLQKQLDALNIPVQFFIAGDGKILPQEQYDYIDTEIVPKTWSYLSGTQAKNNYNIYMCHQKMLQIAKDKQLKCVLFLEDDAIILQRFSSIIQDIFICLACTQWDTCLLGYHHPRKEQEELQYRKDQQVKIVPSKNNIGGFHGVLLNYTAYDKLLAIPPTLNMDVQCPKYTNLFYSIPRLIFYRNIGSNALNQSLGKRFKDYEQFLLEGIDLNEL